ncbi:MAG: DUF3824 domain-containing protein, partial [Acidobacteriaceae bacterium]|nr:DUF3824 domain-containing protein [Acidobacteriaceae bacterium]
MIFRNVKPSASQRKPSYLAFAFALCLAAAAPSAFADCPQPAAPPATDPLHTIIPVHFDASTGDITVGSKTYCGANPGFHLLALQRQPDINNLDAPDMLWDQTYTDAASVNNALKQILTLGGGPIVMVNAVGSYGITLSSVAKGLTPYGAWPDLQVINGALPFIFIGNGGRNPQTALQRGGSTRPVDGYLAQDSSSNYAFIQTDFVQYDITTDGTIKVRNKTYEAANAGYKQACDAAASNSFHLVIVDRESLNTLVDNVYCTGQHPSVLGSMATDLSGVTGEGQLVFIASNGHPIPADWNFGTDGDARVYPLAQQMARLGGYWETMVYLTPNDTYTLVGAPPPPSYVTGARSRARESSSVYPTDKSGNAPTGELHGVLARGRGNWYSPLDAAPTGMANLQLYNILAQAPLSFPSYTSGDQLPAYQSLNNNVCGGDNCIRDAYGTLSLDLGTFYTDLTSAQTATDPATNKDCDAAGDVNAGVPYCQVRAQLQTEVKDAANIHAFYDQISSLWSASGTVTIFSQLSAYDQVKATLPAPPAAPAPSLAGPIANLFLGLASFIPNIGPVFGVADLFFNFGTSLATDQNGNQTIDLTSTIGQLEQQASNQFIAQGTATGNLFQLMTQDWGKLNTLGSDLLTNNKPGSPWYWDFNQLSAILSGAKSAITEGAYQNIMPAAYAIGSYYPDTCCFASQGIPPWGQYPLYAQPRAYWVNQGYNAPYVPVAHPFAPPNSATYIPYTYPNDPGNPYAGNPSTGTILAANQWLGISSVNTPFVGNPTNDYQSAHYEPPDQSLLSTLFTPISQGGVGVYRPAFFEGWP